MPSDYLSPGYRNICQSGTGMFANQFSDSGSTFIFLGSVNIIIGAESKFRSHFSNYTGTHGILFYTKFIPSFILVSVPNFTLTLISFFIVTYKYFFLIFTNVRSILLSQLKSL